MVQRLSQRVRSSVWGPTSTRVRQSQLLRKPAIRAYRLFARTALAGPAPKVLANSMPKAGTHLLTQLLSGAPSLWYAGMHIIDKDFRPDRDEPGDRQGPIDLDAFDKRMSTIRNGQFVTAHMSSLPGVADVLARQGFQHILIIRDPRDVAVSIAFYFAKNRRLNTYERFAAMHSFDERLDAVITGLPSHRGNPSVPSMNERIQQFTPYLHDPTVCLIRFEELVGSQGGGTQEAQHDAIHRVLEHCSRESGEAIVTRLAEQVFATHSATFRRGAIGDWRNHFTPEHEALFEQIAPAGAGRLGYA